MNNNINENFLEDEDSSVDMEMKNDIYDYKGFFIENDEDNREPQTYEFGAHFSYLALYKELEKLYEEQNKNEEEENQNKNVENVENIENIENILKIFRANNEKSRNKQCQNDLLYITNDDNKKIEKDKTLSEKKNICTSSNKCTNNFIENNKYIPQNENNNNLQDDLNHYNTFQMKNKIYNEKASSHRNKFSNFSISNQTKQNLINILKSIHLSKDSANIRNNKININHYINIKNSKNIKPKNKNNSTSETKSKQRFTKFQKSNNNNNNYCVSHKKTKIKSFKSILAYYYNKSKKSRHKNNSINQNYHNKSNLCINKYYITKILHPTRMTSNEKQKNSKLICSKKNLLSNHIFKNKSRNPINVFFNKKGMAKSSDNIKHMINPKKYKNNNNKTRRKVSIYSSSDVLRSSFSTKQRPVYNTNNTNNNFLTFLESNSYFKSILSRNWNKNYNSIEQFSPINNSKFSSYVDQHTNRRSKFSYNLTQHQFTNHIPLIINSNNKMHKSRFIQYHNSNYGNNTIIKLNFLNHINKQKTNEHSDIRNNKFIQKKKVNNNSNIINNNNGFILKNVKSKTKSKSKSKGKKNKGGNCCHYTRNKITNIQKYNTMNKNCLLRNYNTKQKININISINNDNKIIFSKIIGINNTYPIKCDGSVIKTPQGVYKNPNFCK